MGEGHEEPTQVAPVHEFDVFHAPIIPRAERGCKRYLKEIVRVTHYQIDTYGVSRRPQMGIPVESWRDQTSSRQAPNWASLAL